MRTRLVKAYVDLFFVRENLFICDNYPDVGCTLDKISDELLNQMADDEIYEARALRDKRMEEQEQ